MLLGLISGEMHRTSDSQYKALRSIAVCFFFLALVYPIICKMLLCEMLLAIDRK